MKNYKMKTKKTRNLKRRVTVSKTISELKRVERRESKNIFNFPIDLISLKNYLIKS